MIELSKDEARRFLLAHHKLNRFHFTGDKEGLTNLLRQLRCIQLDPLAPLGTSPDLVALARCNDYRMGALFEYLLPGMAFEHFAKERCLLPGEAFAYYQVYAREGLWPRLQGWMNKNIAKVPPEILAAVLEEVKRHGPVTPSQLPDFGEVVPMDWQGWKGTARATTMALEILWARCEVVACGRRGRDKLYDIPERAFPDLDPHYLKAQVAHVPANQAQDTYFRWALGERVAAAGLLPVNSGPHWSMLNDVRKSLPRQWVEEGLLAEVVVEGATTRYLALPGFTQQPSEPLDDAMRILGPLDAFLWYRPLIHQLFDFEYVWEVYKPKDERRWGWYVCPLLHEGQLVGRLQGKVVDDVLVIDTVWQEQGRLVDRDALKAAMKRHIFAMGVNAYRLPRSFRTKV